MAKFPYPPDQENYNVADGSEALSVQLIGGAPRVRRDQLGTYARVTCQWTLGPQEFEAVRTFYKDTTVRGSLPFTIDLYMDLASELTEHNAFFVPGSVKLMSQRGRTFVVGAELDVDPDPVPAP